MLNMIRADFYRLLHTKTFWIMIGITATICAMAVTTQSGGSLLMINGEQINDTRREVAVNGINALGFATNSMIFYCVLPLIVIVLGSEYSKGTLKNIITAGTSRTSFFFGKFISYGLILFFDMLIMYSATFLVGTMIGGIGKVDGEVMLTIIYRLVLFVFFLLALTAVTNLCLFLTKNTAVSVIIAIIVPSVILTFRALLPKVTIFKYIDLLSMLDNAGQFTLKNIGEIREPLIGGAVILVAFLTLTNYLFNKQDL